LVIIVALALVIGPGLIVETLEAVLLRFLRAGGGR
jgi:hypothetical protein